jgi:protein-tyrosine phosphatase
MFLKPRYLFEQPAWFYSRILVGAGEMLTPGFVHKHNITHVINCALPDDSPFWFRNAHPVQYMCLNALDSVDVNILDWYPKFERVLTAFLRVSGAGTVFVHCQCGINRSAFLALTYVTTHYGWPYEPMLISLKRQRPCMFTNPVFRKQTEEFVNGRLQNSKDEGAGRERIVDGDSGLSPSGTSTDPA